MVTDQHAVQQVVSFHGHMCPGLAMGIRAAEVALEQVGPHSADEEVVAIVETDMCAVDAIQYLTGCTFGKGNLMHRDYGKNAYTFLRRSDGKAIRIATKPEGFGPPDPQWSELFAKVRSGNATVDERNQFQKLHLERSDRVMEVPIEELYNICELSMDVPHPARIHASVICASCGEPTMETRIRRLAGRDLCQPCFDQALAS